MGKQEDDDLAYTTGEGMFGRSFRRGIRKGLNALTLGLFSGGGDLGATAGGTAKHLIKDAADEYEMMKDRSNRNGT